MRFLDAPLDSVDDYVAFLSAQNVPVLRATMRELDALRADQDRVSSKRLAMVVLGDPMMTMKLLTHLQRHRTRSQNHDITTIDRAIMMMGLAPFYEAFSNIPTVEDTLRGHPQALVGVLRLIGRSRRAAHFARDWAIARHDLDVDEVTVATLLIDAVAIMCWIFAPALTERVFTLQRADTKLRSSQAQRAVFGCTAHDIQIELVRAWKLPELLITLMDPAHADNPRVRNALLAADFARHLAHGWDDPALPDDIANIEKLLHLGREPLLARLGVPAEAQARFLSA